MCYANDKSDQGTISCHVLAYSGGLDTSTILAWLLEAQYKVVCYLANVGQDEDWKAVEEKALHIGAKKMIIDDLKREFIEELCWKAVQCNAIYEDQYLLGTSLARPIIARGMMRAAAKEGCQFVSHGCTGKGNDQRLPEFYKRFQGRNDLLKYAAEKGIPVTSTKAKPYSIDDNFAYCSYEAGMLKDPNTKTVSPLKALDTPLNITIHFNKGIPVKVVTLQQTLTNAVKLFGLLNKISSEHGVSCINIVKNQFIRLKSRSVYNYPAITILCLAHISIKGLVLDGCVRTLCNNLGKQWFKLLYNRIPKRAFLQPIRLRLYKGNVYCLGHTSQEKLYSEEDASMDSLTTFDPSETSGFMRMMHG
ncbi:LOW QUALITY PROTEIN: argininosuccinate synthase [Colletotrichum cereale]|nr:LOW QUALITY PROTEIN: argininosuccinate synthase [Colletotrichum cereale]